MYEIVGKIYIWGLVFIMVLYLTSYIIQKVTRGKR